MTQRTEPINAIAYAQYHLRGGFKNTAWSMGLALLLVGGFCVATLMANPTNRPDAARGGVYVLLTLQWMLLTLYGTTRVSVAIRQDLSTGLIESHRLTPMNPIAAIIGYVSGASFQALSIAAVLFVIGLAMTVIAQMPPTYWLTANVMVAGASAFLWSLTAMLTFSSKAGVAPLLGLASGFTGGLFTIVPAFAVFASPVVGRSLWTMPPGGSLPAAYAFTLAADVLLAGVFVLAAARRYRSVDTPAFSTGYGMLLLVLWVAITVVGIAQSDAFSRRPYRNDTEVGYRIIAGIITSTLVALVPVAAAARACVLPPDMSYPGQRTTRHRAPWLLVPVCTALASVPVFVVDRMTFASLAERQAGSVAIVASILVSAGFLIAWADLRGRSGWIGVALWLSLPGLAPLVIQAVIDSGRPGSHPHPFVTGFTPTGALLQLWGDTPTDARNGLIGQAVLPLIPAAIFLARWKRDRHPSTVVGAVVGPAVTSASRTSPVRAEPGGRAARPPL